MTAVAWIGLGAMGSRMAARLSDAGHELVVWNRTRAKAEELGLRIAESPREAAERAEVVFTMVADPEALRAVSEGEEGVLAGLREGSVLVEMSTELFVGGDDAPFERVRPLLEALGEPLAPVRSDRAPRPSSSRTRRFLGTISLLGETLALADALGLTRETTWRRARSPGQAAAAEY